MSTWNGRRHRKGEVLGVDMFRRSTWDQFAEVHLRSGQCRRDGYFKDGKGPRESLQLNGISPSAFVLKGS